MTHFAERDYWRPRQDAADALAVAFLAAMPAGDEYRWMDRALCSQADPDAWHPESGQDARPAKRVCMACPVRQECLEYGQDDQFGIFGGLSPRERRDYRRKTEREAA